jgi:hypothetical protein
MKIANNPLAQNFAEKIDPPLAQTGGNPGKGQEGKGAKG